MKQKNLKEILAENDGSLNELVSTISDLCEELRNGQVEGWENTTLLSFLDAMQAWVETTGSCVGDKPTWKFIEHMVKAAKIYE